MVPGMFNWEGPPFIDIFILIGTALGVLLYFVTVLLFMIAPFLLIYKYLF